MADQHDETLRAYLEEVVRIQNEGKRSLTQNDLDAVARELGLSDEDLDSIRRRHEDHLHRAEGFLRYNNWGGAIDELKQAVTLAPTSASTHALLASAWHGRYGETKDADDMNSALVAARRALSIEPRNEMALRIASDMQRRSTPLTTGQKMRRGFVLLGLAAVVLGVVYMIYSAATSGSSNPSTAVNDPAERARMRAESIVDNNRRMMEERAASSGSSKPGGGAKADTGFIQPLAAFGREGIGEGMLTDARSIAVAGDSSVIVADYMTGRVQRFAGDGRFLNGWNIGEGNYVKGMAADRAGNVYIAARGKLLRYKAATGESLGEIRMPRGDGVVDIAAVPGGGLVVLWSSWSAKSGMFTNIKADDAILLLDASGKVQKTWKNAVGNAAGGGPLFNGSIDIDGLGNVYARNSRFIFIFKPDGTFDDKIATPAEDFAIDGKGRIVCAGSTSLFLLNREGQTLATADIEREGDFKDITTISDIAFSPTGELFGVARTKIVRLAMREK